MYLSSDENNSLHHFLSQGALEAQLLMGFTNWAAARPKWIPNKAVFGESVNPTLVTPPEAPPSDWSAQSHPGSAGQTPAL